MLPTNPLLSATAPAGPHLPVALLRQYAAGTLAPAAQHRVEAHTLGCPRCADILEGLLQTPPATTDQAVAQLQQRLRQRVQQVAAPGRQGPRLAPRPRWLSLQLAAAATLLLSLVAGGWWAWQQRHSAAPTAAVVPRPSPAKAVPSGAASPSPTLATVAEAPAAPVAATAAGSKRPRRHPARLTAAASHGRAASTPAAIAVAPARVPVAPVAEATAVATPPAAHHDSLGLSVASRLATTAASTPSNGFAAAPARVPASGMPAAGGLAPMPAGGLASFREQLRRKAAEFVPEAPERSLSGTVQLRLTIDAAGKLAGISVLRGLRADYDEEAQRLVCEGPAWVPGISGGRRAVLQVDVAVLF